MASAIVGSPMMSCQVSSGSWLVRRIDPDRQQTPGMEVRFERTIFAAGL